MTASSRDATRSCNAASAQTGTEFPPALRDARGGRAHRFGHFATFSPMTAGLSDPIPVHAADRLLAAIERKRAPVCVGIDPVLEKLPHSLRRNVNQPSDAVGAIADFCAGVVEAVAPHVPCVKFQSACFERYGSSGVGALERLITFAAKFDLQIILDAKRGDIGISAEHYAAAAFDPNHRADWITINAYLGADGILPFLHKAGGAFALVRTSNPSGDAIQNLRLEDGRSVAQAVGRIIADIGSHTVGDRGYSTLGAVVGATKPADAAALRDIMPQQIFLVPGYGVQGGGLDDVLPCFKSDGTGAIITASRSVIYAFASDDPNWSASVADAAARFADDVGRGVGGRLP